MGRATAALLSTIAVLAACADATAPERRAAAGAPLAGRAAHGHLIVKLTGDLQTGIVETLLPIPATVRLTQAQGVGRPLAGVPLTFEFYTPDRVPAGAHVMHTDANGEAAVAWGLSAQLGTHRLVVRGPGNSSAPVEFTAEALPPSNFLRVDTGWGLSCGTLGDGTAACWGANGLGGLGIGTLDGLPHPEPLLLGRRLVQVSTAAGHVCGLDAGGVAYCWGYNSDSRLGTGDDRIRTEPTAIGGALRFTTISGGVHHGCALDADGRAYCWGNNPFGATGSWETGNTLSPRAVDTTLRFRSIATGGHFTCAVTLDGVAYCWGINDRGQLGTTVATTCGEYGTRCSRVPLAVATSLRFATVAAGDFHACALNDAGATWCWGDGGAGQLGAGAVENSSTPVAVKAPAFEMIGAGGSTTCGITADGAAWCWGANHSGQLGIGEFGGVRATPLQVAGAHAFSDVQPGPGHTCGVTRTRQAFCWGGGLHGQLGNGGTSDQSMPVEVLEPRQP